MSTSIRVWPSRSGDGTFYVGGGDAYANRDRIKAVGGRYDASSKRWVVTRAQAERLRAECMAKVVRTAVCCEAKLRHGPWHDVATEDDVRRGTMRVGLCPYCDSHVNATATILAVVRDEVKEAVTS